MDSILNKLEAGKCSCWNAADRRTGRKGSRSMKCLMTFFVGLFSATTFATPTVSDVTVRQIHPWNGLVEIAVGLTCSSQELADVVCTFVATNAATMGALPVVRIRQMGMDDGAGVNWKRTYIWDAGADLGEVRVDDVALTVDAFSGVQLWADGPYWATCNIGATKPEEFGSYFSWGDTIGYVHNGGVWVSTDGENSIRDFSGDSCQTHDKDRSTLRIQGYIDSTGNLVADHDAATTCLGAPWRMPTDSEFTALINNCTTIWTTRNGVSGRLISGKGEYASKSIFLPAAGTSFHSDLVNCGDLGYCWTSTPYSGHSYYAWAIYISSSAFSLQYNYVDRCSARSIRPVRACPK